ncbi:hypothetical protein Droror1_Dr00019325 [Drosera rotundifolia]
MMILSPAAAPVAIKQATGAGGSLNPQHFGDAVNAVSFGFVATAILISMFLVMAVVEKLFRSRSSGPFLVQHDEGGLAFNRKLEYPSPQLMVSASDVSVLMPGEMVPTFIAHPVPPPLPPPPTVPKI